VYAHIGAKARNKNGDQSLRPVPVLEKEYDLLFHEASVPHGNAFLIQDLKQVATRVQA
jgi:hypothetical protein